MSSEEEFYLRGNPVSEGIAIGEIFFLDLVSEEMSPEFPIAVGEIDSEISRYRRALFSSREDLQRLQTNLADEGSIDAVTIFDAHIQMLQDPLMTTHMEDKIRQMRQNTESVFRSVIKDYENRFSQGSNSFFKQRLIDVMDLSKRVLGHLDQKQKLPFADIPEGSIVLARVLIPSQTASVDVNRVSAFITQTGGGNSHAALIARAKGIPYIDGIDLHHLQHRKGIVIVDGQMGDIIINPTSATMSKYTRLKKRMTNNYQVLEREGHLRSETADGYFIPLYANVESISDLELMHHHHAAGVGLFRSEYLFFQDNSLFSSEERQVAAYLELVEGAKGLPVVMRVLDIGGDKTPDLTLELEKETNPLLGCRGIRFLLSHREIFKTQLRALLRVAGHGNVRILLPLIADISELRQTKQIVDEARRELLASGHEIEENIPLGCMLEVPSAMMICNFLAQECDFLSIGTNDLIQYTLGIDRGNSAKNNFYYPAHPSIIRMIKGAVLDAAGQNKRVGVCGEMASNPHFIPLLLGLGIREFSCSPRHIPLVKQAIRKTSLEAAQQFAERLLHLRTTEEVAEALAAFLAD
jgi:phosphoenolpyruvate-protein phosphotransferase (PTS system enzyme I)